MINFSIGLSGLQVAQRAIEMIGTNISNASTEGYHRQDLQISPISFGGTGMLAIGGAEVSSIKRTMDGMVEREMTRQQTTQGQCSQELSTLQSVESALGDIDSSNMSKSLTDFFMSLRELAGQADSSPLRQQTVTAADSLAGEFRSLSEFLDNLDQHIRLAAEDQVRQVNDLTTEISKLNNDIADVTSRGGSPNMLQDRRDQAIQDLSTMVDVTVESQGDSTGQVNVIGWGIPLVSRTQVTPLETTLVNGQNLGISAEGANFFQDHFRGGTLGGLLSLKNDLIPQIRDQLNTLATQVMQGVNRQHVQGVGKDGPFTELTGVAQPTDKIAAWNGSVSTGEFYVRVTNTATGAVTRQKVSVNADADTMSQVASRIDALTGVSASVVDDKLVMRADSGYTFDFLPVLDSTPQTSAITGTAAATISGQYTGATNQVYTFTVKGSGEVGVSDDLHLEVRNAEGGLVRSLNIGQGYAAGDAVEGADGIMIHVGSGTLNDGDKFTVQALASSDTSGFLAAAGMNTFFSGTSAGDIKVRDEILSDPGQLACSLNPDGTDNENILQMAAVGDSELSSLGHATPMDFYRQFVTSVGQSVSSRKSRLDSIQNILQQLKIQRDGISGVDVNQEAAKLMVFERMYQGVAKFLDSENQSLKYLMDTI